MDSKTIVMVFLSITVLLSFSHPTLATENDDESLLNAFLDVFDPVIAHWPSPGDYNLNVVRSYTKKHLGYLINCGLKMGDGSHTCNIELKDQLLRNKSFSRDCCRKIVKAGKECHTEWMKLFFQFYQLKHFSSESTIKINEMWNICTTETEAISPFSG